jgi:hypothetical protein
MGQISETIFRKTTAIAEGLGYLKHIPPTPPVYDAYSQTPDITRADLSQFDQPKMLSVAHNLIAQEAARADRDFQPNLGTRKTVDAIIRKLDQLGKLELALKLIDNEAIRAENNLPSQPFISGIIDKISVMISVDGRRVH